MDLLDAHRSIAIIPPGKALRHLFNRTICGFVARRRDARMAGAAVAVEGWRGMGDHLSPLLLTERSVHLCVDMQRI